MIIIAAVCWKYPNAVLYFALLPMMALGLASFLWIGTVIVCGGNAISVTVFGTLVIASYVMLALVWTPFIRSIK